MRFTVLEHSGDLETFGKKIILYKNVCIELIRTNLSFL